MNSLRCTLSRLRFFTPVGGLLLLVQCGNFSSKSTKSTPGTSAGGSSSATGGSSGQGGTGDESGGTGGGSGTSCPTIWKSTCPPLGTDLEPLHERLNGGNNFLLAHGAFWLQGSVVFRNPDGSRAAEYLGALRIPYEPGSTPRVLEGNVADGIFVERNGLVFHADASLGRHLAVYEPDGALHQLVDVTGGDSSISMLTGLSVTDEMAVVTSPSCTHVFFIDTKTWQVRHLNTEAQYAGGTTRTLFHDGSLYCMGTSHIFKIDPVTAAVQTFWTDPDLANGIQSVAYSHLDSTSQGLMTWITNPSSGMAPLRLMHPDTLALTDYDDPGVTVLAAHYEPTEDAHYILDRGLYRYQVATKALERVLPEQRPWGGEWDFQTLIQMDDNYYYWVEAWNPDGVTSLNSAEFIVRYPRNP